MTAKTHTTKSGTTFEWEETKETVEALKNLHAGNYKGPLYSPHPDLNNENSPKS